MIWNTGAGDAQSPYWQCITSGYAYTEVWSGGGTYVTGDFVKGSDNNTYEAIADGGQAEDPTTDGDNTYWELEGTAVVWATAAVLTAV